MALTIRSQYHFQSLSEPFSSAREEFSRHQSEQVWLERMLNLILSLLELLELLVKHLFRRTKIVSDKWHQSLPLI